MMTKQPSSSLRKVLSPHSSKAAGLWKLYAMLAMFRRGVGQLSSHPQSGCIFSCAYVLLSAQAILFSDREGLQGLVEIDVYSDLYRANFYISMGRAPRVMTPSDVRLGCTFLCTWLATKSEPRSSEW